jgi:hypothetical protein
MPFARDRRQASRIGFCIGRKPDASWRAEAVTNASSAGLLADDQIQDGGSWQRF